MREGTWGSTSGRKGSWRRWTATGDYPEQRSDVSYGIPAEGGEPRHFLQPTPGRPNDQGFVEGWVEDTRFSDDRGFYREPFEVEVASATPGAVIAYTLDGSPPSPGHGVQVEAPDPGEGPTALVAIGGTTVLRAMAWKEGYVATDVDTQSYLFPEQVLGQEGPGRESAAWGHAGPDWEMDPEIVGHPDPEVRPGPGDLLELATVSLGLDFEEMFGPGGIYIRGRTRRSAPRSSSCFPGETATRTSRRCRSWGGAAPGAGSLTSCRCA